MKTLRVAAGVICDSLAEKKAVFAVARGYGEYKGRWEFPGGKLESGESAPQALVRELEEELRITVRVGEKIATVEWDYPAFHLSMDCFWCEILRGDLTLTEAQEGRWLSRDQLESVPWLPADQSLIETVGAHLSPAGKEDRMKYTQQNARTIDSWKGKYGLRWMEPISHEVYRNACRGDWEITLTPRRTVPHAWIGDVAGKQVLGLAAGGGQQMPILRALGAECTVLDISRAQLDSEREVALREGYSIRILQGDMSEPLPFPDESFDLILNPVSNQYIEDVLPVFRECFRVLKPGGFLLCGLDTGIYWIFDDQEERAVHSLPFNPLKDPAVYEELMANDMGLQFSHTLEEQIGGQLKAGFRLLDLYEDTNGAGPLHEKNVPTFIATRSQKP